MPRWFLGLRLDGGLLKPRTPHHQSIKEIPKKQLTDILVISFSIVTLSVCTRIRADIVSEGML